MKRIELNPKQKAKLIDLYSTNRLRGSIQVELAKEFNLTTRSIRSLAKDLGLSTVTTYDKVLIYDIETCRVEVKTWWTGKQFISHDKLKSEPKIISIAWKWLGSDKVNYLTWDENHCDKQLIIDFLKEYNSASMVIGQNNDRFDNRWVNARAAKHGLFVDRYVKSFDIMKMAKRYFRLPSYSMAYMAQYFGLTLKQSHEGRYMWDMIEDGTPAQQREYLKKMVDYNKGDIITTEELYLTLRPYFGSVTNRAVQLGLPKWACPVSGSKEVRLLKTIFTEHGTIQRILMCDESSHQYKVNNKTYMDFLQRATTRHYE